MPKSKFFFISILCFLSPFLLSAQDPPPYKNAALPAAERVHDLLQRMTIEEKFWQLFMMPGDIDNASPDQYKNGIFGFQVSAGSKNGDATQQLLTYSATENALSLAKK